LKNFNLRLRLDQTLYLRGFVDTLEESLPLVMSGRVLLPDEKHYPKVGQILSFDANILLLKNKSYVSRGGEKLQYAMNYFGFSVKDFICLDVGASTGGFTDYLLKNGAAKIYSVDVGKGQLHNSLIMNKKVISMEKTNARKSFLLPEKVDLIVIDVSFISLKLILLSVISHLKNNSKILVLFKPQFELNKNEVPFGGVVNNNQSISKGVGNFINWCFNNNIKIKGLCYSGIKGRSGNKEIFLLLDNS
tara:strand:+ start:71854 stop:72594 length:741 start_codon:yes stop_codon:yes gene_type:complete